MTCWLCGFKTTELNTNTKAPRCEKSACTTCINVAKLDEEINQAAVVLRQLLAKRCDLRSEQNHAHDPMGRLPVELINSTFELALPRQDKWGVPLYEKWPITPSYLASICRAWRDIAWSNPSLWSTVREVVRKRGSKFNTSNGISFAHDWILRSQTLPLTLTIAIRNVECSEEELKGLLRVEDYHRVRKLRIDSPLPLGNISGLRLFNPNVSPETIDINVSFRSLQISWNNVTFARLGGLCLEDMIQIFRHASQMTCCRISDAFRGNRDGPTFPTPVIVHQKLKVLDLGDVSKEMASMLLDSLTLPSLQDFCTLHMAFLAPAYLPSLVRRSSSPLTNITLSTQHFFDFEPLSGVTHLGLEFVNYNPRINEELLLGKYFPDLCCLTLRLTPFLNLWRQGIISMLLDRMGSRTGGPNEGGLSQVFVVDPGQAHKFGNMWNSGIGKQLKWMMNVKLREDGFELSW